MILSKIKAKTNYFSRIFPAYLGGGNSQLTFWHEIPQVNNNCPLGEIGEYYMPFLEKANYAGPFDQRGIPLLDYRGKIGLQYNPIAISQYGLGHYNLYCRTGNDGHLDILLSQADWLCDSLEENPSGIPVWNHYFDWEYREVLKAPWYSGLAQGQGISLLIRAHSVTKRERYLETANKAFISFQKDISEGGVRYEDENGQIWFEEYITNPPTHILNGFIWALWGLYDRFLFLGDWEAKGLFDRAVMTLKSNLSNYDTGYWSLYEQSNTRLKMLASPFYHSLHIVQMKIMSRLTDESIFIQYANKWDDYSHSAFKRGRAYFNKAVFKLLYY